MFTNLKDTGDLFNWGNNRTLMEISTIIRDKILEKTDYSYICKVCQN